MAKRMMVMVLALMLLLGCVSGQAAVLTKAEQYEAALEGLKAYLNDDETMPIADLNETFFDLGGYEHSAMLEMYTKVLVLIEEGEFTSVQRLINYMKADKGFIAFMEDDGNLGTLEEMEWYAKGRQAEEEKRYQDAAGCYQACPSFMDSIVRWRKLDEQRLEEMYADGIVACKMGTYYDYERAVGIFQQLEDEGGYKDSRAYLNMAKTQMDWLTPTPTPVPQPTAAPQAYDPSVINDGYYHYQLFRYWCVNHGSEHKFVTGNMPVTMRRNNGDTNDSSLQSLRNYLVCGGEWADREQRYDSYYDAVTALLPTISRDGCHWTRKWIYVITPTPLEVEWNDSEECEFGAYYTYDGLPWQGKCIMQPHEAVPSEYIFDHQGNYYIFSTPQARTLSCGNSRYQLFHSSMIPFVEPPEDLGDTAAWEARWWEAAERFCEERGGRLAIISSPAENAFLYGWMYSHAVWEAYFGFSDRNAEGTWAWEGGTPILYTNWHDKEPNGGAHENFAMYYNGFTDATWNDANLNNCDFNFICEWVE